MKHAAFLLPVLLLFGCSKSGTDTKLDPSTVNYQMRATVNGQPWTNASWDNSNLAVTWSKDSSRPVAFWRIKAQNLLRAESIEFSVIYNTLTLNVNYGIVYPYYPQDNGFYATFTSFSNVYGGTVVGNMTYPNAQARFRITRFDGVKMSGDFDFKLGRYISPGVWDSVVVTNGIFTDATRQ
ncbi:MAG: hypothetical protein JNK91_04095 [Ferruginibacter sp.]|nr:hypothetical protein [Ferruginibacter sp.]